MQKILFKTKAFLFFKKLDRIRLVTVQLLKALGFLQQQNVLHADLKPENILLSKGLDLSSSFVPFIQSGRELNSEKNGL